MAVHVCMYSMCLYAALGDTAGVCVCVCVCALSILLCGF